MSVPPLLGSVILLLYFGLLAFLTLFGVHRSGLIWALLRQRRLSAAAGRTADRRQIPALLPASAAVNPAAKPDEPSALLAREPAAQDPLPFITVQLPVFNERFVIERLIDAAAALSYPKERLEIQVLDDSLDDTTALARARVAYQQARGVPIVLIHREDRSGFKAGALEAGLRQARGELVAIFDADFIPAPDFLLRCVGEFEDPRVGMVQARWGHLNLDYSTLTRVQAAMLDGHFQIEHAARHALGCFFNFNGTAGIWRRACIVSGGGWEHDTLTEDLDLSYRAQLQGWKFVYRDDVEVPAELPVELNAFKSQQRRWAKGSMQTCRKLLGRILRAPLPLRVRLEALFHLTSNLGYVASALLSLLMPLAMLARVSLVSPLLRAVDALFLVASLSSLSFFYLFAQKHNEPRLGERLRRIPAIIAVGIGMSLGNALAVVEAMLGMQSPFVRTPKHRIERRGDRPQGYFSRGGWQAVLELGMGLYLLCFALYALKLRYFPSVPFLALFSVGYLYVAMSSIGGFSLHRRVEVEEG